MHMTRRSLFRAGLATTGVALLPTETAAGSGQSGLQELEQQYDVRLGVYARNLGTGEAMVHRQHERFAMCSLFKTLAAAAVLRDLDRRGEVLDHRIHYPPADIIENSRITGEHVDVGMTVRELCDAAIRFSDNAAGNLLLRLIGGPAGITRFAASLGDRYTRLDRWEPDLNASIPDDPQDTTTPAAIATTYSRLLLGDALAERDRVLLKDWMLANQTSFTRFRAGLPEGWTLADKTGGGAYGSLNDAGIAWNPSGVPVVIVALSVKSSPTATADNRLMADVARLVSHTL